VAYFLKIALGLVILLAAFAASGWLAWRFLKKSDDPGRLLVRWILTGALLVVLLVFANSGIFAVMVAVTLGVVLGILWAPSLGAMLAQPLTSFYDGGDVLPEERPFYSIANAKRKQGRYREAILEVEAQLQKFPNDYEGWMLLARIHADDLKDNAAAQQCLELLLNQPDHAVKNLVFALNCSADWHLSLASDPEAARAALTQITERFPDTEYAQTAFQRIAHLASRETLEQQKDRPVIALTRSDRKLGLEGAALEIARKEETPEAAAARLVAHLNDHPFDAEAREQLAALYADHYGRIELAADQLEQLIASPHPTQKQVVHWLNMLADLQIRTAADRSAAAAALRRIPERFPGSAAAANAEKRLAYLDLELNKKTKSQAIALGSYPKNLGLSGGPPKPPAP